MSNNGCCNELERSWLSKMRSSYLKFPSSYLVFDVETTGLELDIDLIVQFGVALVEDRKITREYEFILNWANSKLVTPEFLDLRIARITKEFNDRGLEYRFPKSLLSKQGHDPADVLSKFSALMEAYQAKGGYFLTHNGLRFDVGIVQSHFKGYLKESFDIDYRRVLDTGLIEKAMQLNACPLDNETYLDYAYRIMERYREDPDKPKVHWSLSRHCVPKYDLVVKHDLDMTKAHTAGYDCRLTHLLFEEYRNM